jgi:hypothetical protein
MVHVGHGKFEAVYSFGHFSPGLMGDFVRLQASDLVLDLSDNHMVFTPDRGPVPASNVAVGDLIVDEDGTSVRVESVSMVRLLGLYAPFTVSGQIVVNGILASTYISLDGSQAISFCGMSVSHQWLENSFEFPHRIICYYFGYCHEDYAVDGLSQWATISRKLAMYIRDQQGILRHVSLFALSWALCVFNLVECVVSSSCRSSVVFWNDDLCLTD